MKKIVSICPHCVRTIAEDWSEFGADVRRSSITANSWPAIADQLPSPRDSGDRVVFHDPCYLGRYRGVYDEPREVIGRIGEVIDPPRARERSFCCGAGGGLVFLGEETGKRVNETAREELVATGADVVGAACPFCNTMFRDALAPCPTTRRAAGYRADRGRSIARLRKEIMKYHSALSLRAAALWSSGQVSRADPESVLPSRRLMSRAPPVPNFAASMSLVKSSDRIAPQTAPFCMAFYIQAAGLLPSTSPLA